MSRFARAAVAGAFAIAVLILVVALGARKATVVVPPPPPQVIVSISPNGHVVRLTIKGWKSVDDVDAQIDKFMEDHPELWCSGTTEGPYATLLCYKVNPPTENAQNHTDPP